MTGPALYADLHRLKDFTNLMNCPRNWPLFAFLVLDNFLACRTASPSLEAGFSSLPNQSERALFLVPLLLPPRPVTARSDGKLLFVQAQGRSPR
jgi:hypothetical protein